ncbi:patatin-like phospholipase family protein [candidate division WOR-3 bacterium]|nr:patatin-like phospholipase family protein [candidate division WOR-3 bacterium]
MKLHLQIFLLFFVVLSIPLFGNDVETYPIYLRLKFDGDPNSAGYLWARKVLPEDTCWAEQSRDNKTWDSVPDLQSKVKVGVALAGGVVRGIAHIGVLRAFEENNIPIDAISGTSMGAIIGGLYACGYSPDSLKWIVMKGIDWSTLFSDLPPRQYSPLWEILREKPREPGLTFNIVSNWKKGFPKMLLPFSLDPRGGLREVQKFTDEIALRTLEYEYLAAFDFDNLAFPFGAALTNLQTGKTTLMRKGTVSTAARASGSIPIVFEPMVIKDTSYVDGGVLDNLPVDAFIPIDKRRAPKNNMKNIKGKEINYVIAVYPSKRKGVEKVEEKPEVYGLMGIGVMNKSVNFSREDYVWDNWKRAHARIDVDIKGGFDFYEKKLEEVMDKGYAAASKEIWEIKKAIAIKGEELRIETKIDTLKVLKCIHRIDSIDVLEIINKDTLMIVELSEREKILKAIRYKQDSYVDKRDICDAIKRIYNLGKYTDVRAKIKKTADMCIIDFLVRRKDVETHKVFINLKEMSRANDDSTKEAVKTAEKAVKDSINKLNRILNFEEMKELVESNLVKQGFVAPIVNNVEYKNIKEEDDSISIIIKGNVGTHLKGVYISCSDSIILKKIEGKFEKTEPLNPKNVRNTLKNVYKDLELKTISVEGFKDNKLLIAARKKSNATLEFPSITIEGFEGINFFGEMRVRNWTILNRFSRSPYFNLSHNFIIKEARELPQGDKIGIGFERCTEKYIIVPEFHYLWRRLRYPGRGDSTNYDREFKENNIKLTLPLHLSRIAAIPGFEFSRISADNYTTRYFAGSFQIRYDELNRTVFPDSGCKFDFDSKFNIKPYTWLRTRVRLTLIPVKFRFHDKFKTTITTRLYWSKCFGKPPEHEKYSLGGFSPIGSYCLRLYDYEDLPGYKKDDFREREMWKLYFSWRFTLMEIAPLGLRFNVQMESFMYYAGVGDHFSIDNRLEECPGFGLYFDTSYLNVGLITLFHKETFKKSSTDTFSHFMNHFHFSVVYYGLAL